MFSNEHFTVDGTLIEARASEPRHAGPAEGSDIGRFGRLEQPDAGFSRGEAQQSRGAGHQSTGDAEARLYKKSSGQEAKVAYLWHVLTVEEIFGWMKTIGGRAQGETSRPGAGGLDAEPGGPTPKRRTRNARHRVPC